MMKGFIFAGEASGDLHGSHLIQSLHQEFQHCELHGVAGPQMRLQKVTPFLPMENFEVMGFTDVLFALPRLWKYFHQIKNHILKGNYDAVVLIDYPGFNLRLAKALRNKKYKGKIIQYISPSVWAHGRKRIDYMAATLDLLLTIYPFEKECFKDSSLPVVYVGNPLKNYLENRPIASGWHQKTGLTSGEFIALFPGSRQGEVARNLPIQLQAAIALKKHFPSLQIAVSCGHASVREVMQNIAEGYGMELNKDLFIVPREHTYSMMQECRTAIAKSGTVTLELALNKCPTLVTYPLTILNKWIAKTILSVNLPHYCIVNILGNKEVFPEFIDTHLCLEEINQKLYELHIDGLKRESVISNCRQIQEILGSGAASRQAALAIKDLFL